MDFSAEDCVKETSELTSLLIRAGSKSWTKGGTIHQTEEILNANNGTFELRISPPFEIGDKVDTLRGELQKNITLQHAEGIVNEVKLNKTILQLYIMTNVTK